MYRMSQTLICNHCQKTNLLFRFSYNKKYDKYYPHNMCRSCSSLKAAEWISNNRERAKITAQAVDKKRNQTPERRTWLTNRRKKLHHAFWEQDLTDLVTKEAYDLAKKRKAISGFSWHVDHIIPVSGKKVSGLHVWNNLQVIPAIENIRKNNKCLL